MVTAFRKLRPILLTLIPFASFALEESRDNTGFYPVLNVKSSYPQDWAVELGAVIGKHRGGAFGGETQGIFLSFEPGGNGTKFNVGYGLGATSPMGPLRVSVAASSYQAGKDAHGISEGDDYFGVQGGCTAMFMTFSVGLYYGADNHKALLSAGIGFGL